MTRAELAALREELRDDARVLAAELPAARAALDARLVEALESAIERLLMLAVSELLPLFFDDVLEDDEHRRPT